MMIYNSTCVKALEVHTPNNSMYVLPQIGANVDLCMSARKKYSWLLKTASLCNGTFSSKPYLMKIGSFACFILLPPSLLHLIFLLFCKEFLKLMPSIILHAVQVNFISLASACRLMLPRGALLLPRRRESRGPFAKQQKRSELFFSLKQPLTLLVRHSC